MPFSGRATPARYSAGGEFARATPPAQPVPVIPQDNQKVNGDADSKQALYKLLGQDLDICVEAHADAYEQARKKWAECSVDEWTRGADGTPLFSPPLERPHAVPSPQNSRRDSQRCSTLCVAPPHRAFLC